MAITVNLNDQALLDSVAAKTAAARVLLRQIAREFSPAAFANSLGAEDMVLTDMIFREGLDIGVFSLDTGRLPEEITIYNNHVTGRTNGQMRAFDFATNRVPFFEPSCFIPTNTDYHLLFGSKVALGNAINRILHEQYEVHDDHRHDADHRYNDNHEWVPVTRYTSNHVLLRLKATNYW